MRLLLLVCLIAGLAGCSREMSTEPTVKGAVCSTCNAPIQDERFAGQYRMPDGTVKSFDDPACLFRALRAERGEPSVVRFRAFAGDRWLKAEETFFARIPGTPSPQGSGWAAYPSFGAAQDAVTSAGSGAILSYEEAAKQIGADAQS
jgi:hypothetical protein